MTNGIFLVKFNLVEDREHILNLAPLLFNQNLFSMVSYVKNRDRKIVLEVGGAVGKILAIEWHDKDRCWVEFTRVRVLGDIVKPLRRVANVVEKDGNELLCFFKYERLPVYCYICGRIGHNTMKCS